MSHTTVSMTSHRSQQLLLSSRRRLDLGVEYITVACMQTCIQRPSLCLTSFVLASPRTLHLVSRILFHLQNTVDFFQFQFFTFLFFVISLFFVWFTLFLLQLTAQALLQLSTASPFFAIHPTPSLALLLRSFFVLLWVSCGCCMHSKPRPIVLLSQCKLCMFQLEYRGSSTASTLVYSILFAGHAKPAIAFIFVTQ